MERILSRLGPAVTTLVALALLVAIGAIDFRTGVEVRIFPLYFLPVGLVSWRLGKLPGVVAGLTCAATWYVSNDLAGAVYSAPYVIVVNLLSILSAFLLAALLIGELRRQASQERALARSDLLTGLPNRRAFEESLEREVARARRHELPLTVAYLDLDGFKRVNDGQGHRAGDIVLQDTARALRAALRASDVVGRLGGDEFGLLLLEAPPEAAAAALHKLKSGLDAELRARGWEVTASVGAVSVSRLPPPAEELLQRADALMYAAKSSGKDSLRHEVLEPPPGVDPRASARRRPATSP